MPPGDEEYLFKLVQASINLLLRIMDSVVAQVQSLAEKTDESGRNKLLNALRDLQYELETPKDAFMRIYNSVRLSSECRVII